jgi:hypothetical protein
VALKKIFCGWYMVGAGSGLQFLHAGMILGLSFMIIVIGQVGGPMIATGFTILALLAGLGSLFFILAKRPRLPAAAAG